MTNIAAELRVHTLTAEEKAQWEGVRYLSEHAAFMAPNDEKALQKHIKALFKLGVPLDWAAPMLGELCAEWEGVHYLKGARIPAYVRRAWRNLALLKPPADEEQVSRFKAKDLAYFEALPPVQWLLDGIIAKGSFFVLYGREKSGKTFLSLNLALAIAAGGREFCGLRTEWGRVLYIIAEGNESEFASRMRVWIEANSTKGKDRDNLRAFVASNFKVVTVPVMVNELDQIAELVRENPGDWDLVVIDTYLRNTSGNVNDPKDAVLFVNGCDTIRRETGAAVLVCHHAGKDESRGAFGSMHLTGACDGAAVVIRRDNADERIMRVKLMRNGDDGQDDIVFRLPRVLVRIDDDGREHHSCHVEFVERRKQGSRAATDTSDSAETVLLAIHSKAPETINSLAEHVAIPRRTIQRHLKTLRDEGLIVEGALKLTPAGVAEIQNISEVEDDFG